MAAFADRELRRSGVVRSCLGDEDELIFVGSELEEQRASRAGCRQNVCEQERRCRRKIGRFGESRQQGEMTSVSLRWNESRRARQLDGHSMVAGYWLLVTGYWLLVTGYWLLVTGF
jgi:hypothetical protein